MGSAPQIVMLRTKQLYLITIMGEHAFPLFFFNLYFFSFFVFFHFPTFWHVTNSHLISTKKMETSIKTKGHPTPPKKCFSLGLNLYCHLTWGLLLKGVSDKGKSGRCYWLPPRETAGPSWSALLPLETHDRYRGPESRLWVLPPVLSQTTSHSQHMGEIKLPPSLQWDFQE